MNKKFEVDILSTSNFTSFGFCMSDRKFSTLRYRYSFNGMEKDDEVKGEGNSYDFGARIYDGRLGRWLSVDAKIKAHESPYCSYSNNPLLFVDNNGKDTMIVHFTKVDQKDAKVVLYRVSFELIKNGVSQNVDAKEATSVDKRPTSLHIPTTGAIAYVFVRNNEYAQGQFPTGAKKSLKNQTMPKYLSNYPGHPDVGHQYYVISTSSYVHSGTDYTSTTGCFVSATDKVKVGSDGNLYIQYGESEAATLSLDVTIKASINLTLPNNYLFLQFDNPSAEKTAYDASQELIKQIQESGGSLLESTPVDSTNTQSTTNNGGNSGNETEGCTDEETNDGCTD